MVLDMDVYLTVDNQNYAQVKIVSLYFDVYHHYSGKDLAVGNVSATNVVFPKRSVTVSNCNYE